MTTRRKQPSFSTGRSPLDPANKNSHISLFLMWYRAGDREQAAKAIESYLEQYPSDTVAARQLEIYRDGGEFDPRKSIRLQGNS